MVLACFDQQGMFFTNCMLLSITANAAYIVKVLGFFLKLLKQKRAAAAAAREWFLCWGNALVNTAAVGRQYLVKHNIQGLPCTLFSPDLAPAGFLLLPKVKDHLAGITLTQDTF
jgi:hypothetical protein